MRVHRAANAKANKSPATSADDDGQNREDDPQRRFFRPERSNPGRSASHHPPLTQKSNAPSPPAATPVSVFHFFALAVSLSLAVLNNKEVATVATRLHAKVST
jgi:hypothetical protein